MMKNTELKTFLDEVEAYLVAADVSATAFGKQVMSDPNFVHHLRKGRDPTLSTAGHVRAWIAKHPPLDRQ